METVHRHGGATQARQIHLHQNDRKARLHQQGGKLQLDLRRRDDGVNRGSFHVELRQARDQFDFLVEIGPGGQGHHAATAAAGCVLESVDRPPDAFVAVARINKGERVQFHRWLCDRHRTVNHPRPHPAAALHQSFVNQTGDGLGNRMPPATQLRRQFELGRQAFPHGRRAGRDALDEDPINTFDLGRGFNSHVMQGIVSICPAYVN